MRWLAVVLALTLAACGGGEPSNDDIYKEIDRQLEENRESLPNDVATDAPVPRRSVEQFVRVYQRFGFFHGERAERAAARIAKEFEREYGERPPLATRSDELELLSFDHKRVWFSDIELDVLEGNDVYVSSFAEWAKISRGAFEPRNVRERWHGENGPVTISFELDGRPHSVEAAPQGDFLDLCVLTAGINPLLDTRRFELYRPDGALGQVAFVVALTAREKRALERHGWTFATPEEVRLTFGYGQLYEEGAPAGC